MEAVHTKARKEKPVEWLEVYPSLFGLYGALPLDGHQAQIDLGEPVVASMASGEGGYARLRIAADDVMVELDLQVAADTQKLRNTVMSRWMREHYPALPSLPLESVLSLIISQATPNPSPVWPNAGIKPHQWESILCHALETDDPHTQSARIIEGLVLQTHLLECLRRQKCASSVLLGLDAAMTLADPSSSKIVRRMAGRVANGDGLLVVAERGHSVEAEARLREAIADAGWLALVGRRPLESCALEIAGSGHIPAVVLDSDKMKTSPVLDHVDRVMTLGDENRFGVMRRRAIEMVGALKES